MAISDQTSCPAAAFEYERRAMVRVTVSRLSTLCAISFAMAVAGCAQNPAPREVAARPPQVRTASTTPVASPRRHAEHAYFQARARKLDPALLAAQPAPDCEYKRANVATLDPDEWARLKSEYELQCYRETEKAARTRLGLLQSSIRQLQN